MKGLATTRECAALPTSISFAEPPSASRRRSRTPRPAATAGRLLSPPVPQWAGPASSRLPNLRPHRRVRAQRDGAIARPVPSKRSRRRLNHLDGRHTRPAVPARAGRRWRQVSDLIGRFLVLPVRIELTASPLPRECSTTELRQRSHPAHRSPAAGRPVQWKMQGCGCRPGGPVDGCHGGRGVRQRRRRCSSRAGPRRQQHFSAVPTRRSAGGSDRAVRVIGLRRIVEPRGSPHLLRSLRPRGTLAKIELGKPHPIRVLLRHHGVDTLNECADGFAVTAGGPPSDVVDLHGDA